MTDKTQGDFDAWRSRNILLELWTVVFGREAGRINIRLVIDEF